MGYNNSNYKGNNNYGGYNQGNGGNRNRNDDRKSFEPYKKVFEPLDKTTYVDKAEKIIKTGDIRIKRNQIRIILDLINEVYIPVKNSKQKELSDDVKSKLQYVKMKIAYQAGRDKDVKDFVQKSNIMGYIDEVKDKDGLFLLAHYMEALVAYHRFYIDKE